MRRFGLGIACFILLAALGLCLVALISDEWRYVIVSNVPVTGLAHLSRTQGLIKECWSNVRAFQFNITKLSTFVKESSYCLHIGIGTVPYVMDKRAGLLSGALVAFILAALIGLIVLIITLVAIFNRSKEYGKTFNSYLRGGVGLCVAAALLSVLGMIFYHISLMLQDDETINLASSYPEEFYKDMTMVLRQATTYEYGYAFWSGWLAVMSFLICTLLYLALLCDCCGIDDREEQLQVTPRLVSTPLKPVTKHVLGPPIYMMEDQYGNQVFYDPWKKKVLDKRLPIAYQQQSPSPR